MTPSARRLLLKPRIATLLLLALIAIPLAMVMARALRTHAATPSFTAGAITETDKLIATQAAREISFWEGSRVELEDNSKARVVTVAEPRVEVRLEQGGAHFVVEAGPNREWIASAGPFRMYINGADFRLGWSPDKGSFELQFNSGSAELLSACGQAPHRLREKTVIQLVCLPRLTSKPTPLPEPSPKKADPAASPHGQAGQASTVDGFSWKALAAKGSYEDAFARARSVPFTVQCKTWSADDLTQAADLAVLAKEPLSAEHLLGCVRERFGRTEAGPNAAFRLGKLLLESRPSDAAKWFGTYEKERPNGDLVAEALGRQMDASSRAGDAASARHVAEKYLERFATGPYAAQAKSLLRR